MLDLVSATFPGSTGRVRLAVACHTKTHGNAFFVRRWLESLYDEVARLYRKVAELSAMLSASKESELTLPESPADLSFMVTYVLDLDSEEKQKLLEITSTGERPRPSPDLWT